MELLQLYNMIFCLLKRDKLKILQKVWHLTINPIRVSVSGKAFIGKSLPQTPPFNTKFFEVCFQTVWWWPSKIKDASGIHKYCENLSSSSERTGVMVYMLQTTWQIALRMMIAFQMHQDGQQVGKFWKIGHIFLTSHTYLHRSTYVLSPLKDPALQTPYIYISFKIQTGKLQLTFQKSSSLQTFTIPSSSIFEGFHQSRHTHRHPYGHTHGQFRIRLRSESTFLATIQLASQDHQAFTWGEKWRLFPPGSRKIGGR